MVFLNCFFKMPVRVKPTDILSELNFKIYQKIADEIDDIKIIKDINTKIKNHRYLLSDRELRKLERNPNTIGEDALHLFGKKGLMVKHLTPIADELRLEDLLLLLKDPVPLSIILEPPPVLNIFIGGAIEIKCTAYALPYPECTWFKENKEVCVNDSGILKIENAKPGDSGSYMCRWNTKDKKQFIFSNQESWTILNVKNKPIEHNDHLSPLTSTSVIVNNTPEASEIAILKEPSSVETGEGGIACFTVEAECNDVLYYQWYKNGTAVEGQTCPRIEVTAERIDFGTHSYLCKLISKNPDETTKLERMTREVTLKVRDDPNICTASDKVALLIGVSITYSGRFELPGVHMDLERLSKLLKQMNYKVISILDPSKDDILFATWCFRQMLDKGVYAVLYYAGHGVEQDGQHYMVPYGIKEGFEEQECVCLEEILQCIQQDDHNYPSALFCFYDTCRTMSGYWPRTQRYQPKSRQNEMIFFSTSFSQKSYEKEKEGGIFTKHLIDSLEQNKDLTIYGLQYEICQKMTHMTHMPIKQHPELASVKHKLASRIKLNDLVRTNNTKTDQERMERMREISHLPQPRTFDELNYSLNVHYTAKFTNTIQIHLAMQTRSPSLDALFEDFEISFEPRLRHTTSGTRLAKEILLFGLETVKADIYVNVLLHFTQGTKPEQRKTFQHVLYLGRPLIANIHDLRNEFMMKTKNQCHQPPLPQDTSVSTFVSDDLIHHQLHSTLTDTSITTYVSDTPVSLDLSLSSDSSIP